MRTECNDYRVTGPQPCGADRQPTGTISSSAYDLSRSSSQGIVLFSSALVTKIQGRMYELGGPTVPYLPVQVCSCETVGSAGWLPYC